MNGGPPASLSSAGRVLDRALAVTRAISHGAAVIGGVMILLAGLMIAVDVFQRRVIGLKSWGADEFSYYALAVSTSWAFGFALLEKAHIRIDVLLRKLNRPLRAACDVIGLLGLTYFAAIATMAAYEVADRSWTRGVTSITPIATPLWIPQMLWLAGFILLTTICCLLILRVAVALAVERSYETAERYAGAVSVDEETAAAMAEAADALGTKR